MPLPRRILVSLLFPLMFPVFAHAQGPISPPHVPAESLGAYQDSPDGLRMQLQDVLAVARERNAPQLDSLIKQMEIPNYEDWFTKAYGNERAGLWAMPYGRDLARSESDFEALLLQLADEDGEIAARKVNDSPAPGMEEHMLDGLQGAAEIFFANWKKRDASSVSRGNPIGYFVFIDGRFRLVRTFRIMAIRPVTGFRSPASQGIWSAPISRAQDNLPSSGQNDGPIPSGVRAASMPTCADCPSPEYSQEARKKHLEGTVQLQVLIQPDGLASEIQVVKSPDPELSQMAVAGVSGWRFNPARDADGDAVPDSIPIEVTFRIPK